MPAPKKSRKKATTPLGRSILQKERQRLAKEQATLGEQFLLQARERMAAQQRLTEAEVPEHIAVNKGMVQRVAAVLASERVNVPIHTNATTGHFSAWTDFDRIDVQYHLHDDARLTAAILRGMLYHEGGHVRFTIPYATLQRLATEEYQAINGAEADLPVHVDRPAMQRAWNVLEDQRMETAVVSDSPRKAVYFTPMVLGEIMPDPTMAKDNWPLVVWRKYLPKVLRDRARSYWITQHGVDKAIDIEDAVTRYVTTESPLGMWMAIIDMTELLKGAEGLKLNFSRHQAPGYGYRPSEPPSDKLQIPIDPSMLDEETLQEIVNKLEEEAQAAEEAAANAPAPIEEEDADDIEDDDSAEPTDEDEDEHDDDEDDEQAHDEWLPEEPEIEYTLPITNETEDESDTPVPSFSGDSEDADDDDAPSENTEDSDDDGVADAPVSPLDASNHESEATDSTSAGATGSHDEDDFDEEAFQKALEEGLEEAEQERYEDKALDGDMEAYEVAKWDSDSKLLPYNAGVETDGELIAVADNLAYEIEQTFQASTIDRAPAWVEQQRRGVVNVLRYETRQPGDAEFYRAWVDDDQPGYDIAVSILLDYSGSMDSMTPQLGQAGYAAKLACQRLNIPCTVTLWDTNAKTLWDAHEIIDDLPRISATGGTEPTAALADLDNQRMEKDKHIVLIFTDGEWQDWHGGQKSLTAFKDNGRYFISFILDDDDRMADVLKRYGSDEAYVIQDLMEIPRRLEMALIENS